MELKGLITKLLHELHLAMETTRQKCGFLSKDNLPYFRLRARPFLVSLNSNMTETKVSPTSLNEAPSLPRADVCGSLMIEFSSEQLTAYTP